MLTLKLSALFFLAQAANCLPVLNQYSVIQPSTYLNLQPLPNQAMPRIIYPEESQKSLSHPAVVRNALAESQYSPELLNDFYKNPVIASKLAKESWFTDKEFPVYQREAEKIPRQKIYEIIDRIVNH